MTHQKITRSYTMEATKSNDADAILERTFANGQKAGIAQGLRNAIEYAQEQVLLHVHGHNLDQAMTSIALMKILMSKAGEAQQRFNDFYKDQKP